MFQEIFSRLIADSKTFCTISSTSSIRSFISGILDKTFVDFFHFLAQFLITTSKAELDYCQLKLNAQVAEWVAERLKTYDLRKLGNFKKILEMLGFDGEYSAVHPKGKFWRFALKNRKESAVKHSIENSNLLNFMNLSPTSCPRLWCGSRK